MSTEKSMYCYQGTDADGNHVYIKLAVVTSPEPLSVKDFEMQGGECPELHNDPRILTATELLGRAFEIDQLTVFPHGALMRRHMLLAGDPFRSTLEDEEVQMIRAHLEDLGVDNLRPIMPLRPSPTP